MSDAAVLGRLLPPRLLALSTTGVDSTAQRLAADVRPNGQDERDEDAGAARGRGRSSVFIAMWSLAEVPLSLLP